MAALWAGVVSAQGTDEAAPVIPVPSLDTPPAAATRDERVGEESETQRLDEVMVTATKRAESVRDIPASVSALRGEDLEQHGYQSQEDFLKLVPGVSFANDNITPNRITIRGVGADLNTSNTTGVFLGDVPFEDPILPRVTLDPNPFDLARIEVLKGPQGTLFGGSALNGAVRYVPEEPKLAVWEAKGFGLTESLSEGGIGYTYGGAINAPMGQTVALRVVGFDRVAPGWTDDRARNLEDVNRATQHGGRIMGLWQPDEKWKISGMMVMQATHTDDMAITDNRDGDLSRQNTPQASPVNSRYNLQTLGVQYSFDSFDVLSQTSHTDKKFYGKVDASRIANLAPTPPPSMTIYNDNRSESVMQELRFTSNDGFNPDWKWLGGVFYRRVEMHEVSDILVSDMALPLPPLVLNALGSLIPGFGGYVTEDGKLNTARGRADPVVVSEQALFGEVTGTFFEDLEVTLGLRAFRTISDSSVYFSGPLTANQIPGAGSTEAAKIGHLQEQGINPKLALKYTFNDNVTAYASVARGFRFGGAQVLVGTLTSRAPDFYKSDIIWSYEAGLRTQWLQRTLTFDVTPFQIDWIDPQLQQADATGLGSYFDNVGGARGRGVELATRWLTPLAGLSLSFSGSYTNTVTTKPFTTSNGTKTEPGTQWPLSAKWQSASILGYQRPLFAGWAGGATVTYTTISSAYNTLSYLDTVFGYKTLDLMLNAGNPDLPGRPEFSLSLNNATDVRGVISGVNNPQFPLDHNYIRPRALVARVALAF